MEQIFNQIQAMLDNFVVDAITVSMINVKAVFVPAFILFLFLLAYELLWGKKNLNLITKYWKTFLYSLLVVIFFINDNGEAYRENAISLFVNAPQATGMAFVKKASSIKNAENIGDLVGQFSIEYLRIVKTALTTAKTLDDGNVIVQFFSVIGLGIEALVKNIILQIVFLIIAVMILGAFIYAITIQLGAIVILYVAIVIGPAALLAGVFERSRSIFQGI